MAKQFDLVQYIKSFFTWNGSISRKEFLVKSFLSCVICVALAALYSVFLYYTFYWRMPWEVREILAYILFLPILVYGYTTSCLVCQFLFFQEQKKRTVPHKIVFSLLFGVSYCVFFLLSFVIFLSSLKFLDNTFGASCVACLSSTITCFALSFAVRYLSLAAEWILQNSKDKITLVNKNKLLKECPNGFSWTTLFFGPFVPLTRGDLKWFAIMLIFAITLIGWIAMFVFCFKYNKIYIKDCLEKGYKPYDEKAKKALKKMGIRYAK